MSALRISNRDARRLWLDAQGLADAPIGSASPIEIIRKLGFVQIDTIQVLARAHHHILWSRSQTYREPMLDRLLARDRAVFEHFTHDASILPVGAYPLWRRQFRRMEAAARRWAWHRGMLDEDGRAEMRARIAREGPLSTHAFDTKIEGERQMWSRPPHKLALDYMWYAGDLSTSHRDGVTKYYDLTERCIPAEILADERSDDDQVDWLCRSALERLAFASAGDVKRFWEAADLSEVRRWIDTHASDVVQVEVETADGGAMSMLAPTDVEARLRDAPQPTSRLRILNPFDPVSRDRARLQRLFGFDYRIEIFVPKAQRRWGYYVYPLLEGDRFVGRIEAKADRKAGRLDVIRLWPEPSVAWGAARRKKLQAELERMARFIGVGDIAWSQEARAI